MMLYLLDFQVALKQKNICANYEGFTMKRTHLLLMNR